MTAEQQRRYAVLVDAFWSGDCGEVEFFEVGLDLGASLDQLNDVLADVRTEDGVF